MIVYVLIYEPFDAHNQTSLVGIYSTYKKALQMKDSKEDPSEYTIGEIEVQE